MQFKTPFGQPPSNQPEHQQPPQPQWQPSSQPLPPQPQWQPQPYLPQYQPPPIMQPSPPKKKSRKRLWLIIVAAVFVLALASAVALRSTNISTTDSSHTAAPTQVPTHAIQSTSQMTPIATSTATAKNLKYVKPTHGIPTIDGQISDFFGKYGTPLTTNGKDTVWLLSSDGSLSLDVRDTGSGVVGYMSISTPDNWSKQKLQAFCLSFAPHNYTLEQTSFPSNSSGVYVYKSPRGKFALHLSSGYPEYCYMNTLP